MPASSSRFASGWRTLGLAVALPASLAVFSPASFAADVVVITDSRHPVRTMGGEQLIELDEAPRIEAELSAALPADPGQATAIVKRRLSQGGADLQRRAGGSVAKMAREHASRRRARIGSVGRWGVDRARLRRSEGRRAGWST